MIFLDISFLVPEVELESTFEEGMIHQGAPQGPGARWWVVLTSYVGWSSTLGARKLIFEKKSC